MERRHWPTCCSIQDKGASDSQTIEIRLKGRFPNGIIDDIDSSLLRKRSYVRLHVLLRIQKHMIRTRFTGYLSLFSRGSDSNDVSTTDFCQLAQEQTDSTSDALD